MARGLTRAVVVVVLAAAISIASSARAQGGLVARLPVEQRIADLARPDAHAREEAAHALALTGPTVRVVPELVRALTGEAVPEARAALVLALARRGDATAAAALIETWERATPLEREHLLDGLAAIGTDEALAFLVDRLASELHRPGVCARLARRGDAGVDRIAQGLASPERRDAAALCLAQIADRPRAADALIAVAPMLGPGPLGAVLEALDADARAIPLAVAAVESTDAELVARALGLLSRHAPDRLAVERWRALGAETDARGASAVVALLSLDRSSADPILHSVAGAGGARAALLFEALLRAPSVPVDALAPFVELETTRAAALDRLATVPGGVAVLTALPVAPDVLVALAIAAARGDAGARGALRERSAGLDSGARLALLAIAGDVDARACGDGAASPAERRAVAYCLSRAPDGAEVATAALESERDASVVAWLALAAREAPSEPALLALLSGGGTRLAVLHLLPAALRRASAPSRRRLTTLLVRATRATRASERAEAIRALGALGDERHRATLARALEDESPSVRISAAGALARLPPEPSSEIRRLGRARIEHDEDVLAALEGTSIEDAAAPLRVRVDVRGDASRPTGVEIALADGRALVLTPIGTEIVLFGVPDRTARARILDPERD